jgi:hypothetical protein
VSYGEVNVTLIPINRDPARWQLMMLAGFGCVALAWAARATSQHAPSLAIVLWATAVALAGVGVARPAWLRGPYVAMSYLAYPPALMLSLILLAAVYYLVLAPIGIVLRLCGHDPLQRRRDRGATYWTPCKMEEDPERYFRPF